MSPHAGSSPEYVGREESLSLRGFLTLEATVIVLFGPYVQEMIVIAQRGQPWMWRQHPTVWSSYLLYADTVPLLVAALGLMAVGTVIGLRKGMGWAAIFCLTVLLLPVIVPVVMSKGKHPMFTPRYSIGALAAFYPLVAYGIVSMMRPLAVLSIVAVLGLSWPHLAEDFRVGANGQRKEDVRAIAGDIAELAKPGDVVWCPDFLVHRVLGFYLHPQPAVTLVENLPDLDVPPKRLWLVEARAVPLEPALSEAYIIKTTRTHQGIKLLEMDLIDPSGGKK
jgi:hypothetical protein